MSIIRNGIVFAGLVLLSTPVLAGGDIGNGGGSIICRDGGGEMTSVDLLDLWEGRLVGLDDQENALVIPDRVEPAEQQLDEAIARIASLRPRVARLV